MFKKVLIAEDFQAANKGIVTTLIEKLHIPEIQEEYYCDKAFTRLQVSLVDKNPFQLLITDLGFKENHVERKLTSGIELIKAARALHPNIKVIVNSMEDNPVKIKKLFQELKIDGYVCKGRDESIELVNAMHTVYDNKTYVSPQINLDAPNTIFELDEFDILILKELANGVSKKEIGEKFRAKKITPNSESTIDKRVSKLFDEFEAKNTTHLIAKLTKIGLI